MCGVCPFERELQDSQELMSYCELQQFRIVGSAAGCLALLFCFPCRRCCVKEKKSPEL